MTMTSHLIYEREILNILKIKIKERKGKKKSSMSRPIVDKGPLNIFWHRNIAAGFRHLR